VSVADNLIDARALDIGKPQTNNGRCDNEPANKRLINRRLKPHRRPFALARKQTLCQGGSFAARPSWPRKSGAGIFTGRRFRLIVMFRHVVHYRCHCVRLGRTATRFRPGPQRQFSSFNKPSSITQGGARSFTYDADHALRANRPARH
jgi:hypothetical protein